MISKQGKYLKTHNMKRKSNLNFQAKNSLAGINKKRDLPGSYFPQKSTHEA